MKSTKLSEIDPNDTEHWKTLNELTLDESVMEKMACIQEVEDKMNFLKHCQLFFVELCLKMKVRYNRFAVDFSKYKRCFHPKNVLSVDFYENTFKTLDTIFSEVPILTNFHDVALMIQINEEWNDVLLYDIPDFITEEKQADIFCVHMKQITDENGIHLFKNLSEFALKFISLSNSNASSDREFSQLNRQVTLERASLIFPTIRGILLTATSKISEV